MRTFLKVDREEGFKRGACGGGGKMLSPFRKRGVEWADDEEFALHDCKRSSPSRSDEEEQELFRDMGLQGMGLEGVGKEMLHAYRTDPSLAHLLCSDDDDDDDDEHGQSEKAHVSIVAVNEDDEEVGAEVEIDPPQRPHCLICKERVDSGDVAGHYQSEHPFAMQCPYTCCDFIGKTPREFRDHWRFSHTKERTVPLECPCCPGELFRFESEVWEHTWRTHGRRWKLKPNGQPANKKRLEKTGGMGDRLKVILPTPVARRRYDLLWSPSPSYHSPPPSTASLLKSGGEERSLVPLVFFV